jgi:hypothetical protein
LGTEDTKLSVAVAFPATKEGFLAANVTSQWVLKEKNTGRGVEGKNPAYREIEAKIG